MTLMDIPAEPPVVAPVGPTTPVAGAERRVAVAGVSWGTYVRLCDEIVHGATRITFDRGRMEIVTVSQWHERVNTVLGRIIEAYADAVGAVAEGLGSMTMRREDLDRGLEPDKCYYVANAAAMTGRDDRPLDLTVDPPPDLAIEVDISPPDVSKQPVYAAMGVPEIWRYDGRTVTYLIRTPDGRYTAAERSLAFPDLPVGWVNDLLRIGLAHSQSAAVAEVRRRVRA